MMKESKVQPSLDVDGFILYNESTILYNESTILYKYENLSTCKPTLSCLYLRLQYNNIMVLSLASFTHIMKASFIGQNT